MWVYAAKIIALFDKKSSVNDMLLKHVYVQADSDKGIHCLMQWEVKCERHVLR